MLNEDSYVRLYCMRRAASATEVAFDSRKQKLYRLNLAETAITTVAVSLSMYLRLLSVSVMSLHSCDVYWTKLINK